MRYIDRIRKIYNKYIKERNEEPRFLIILSFFLTFIIARLVVYNIQYHIVPIANSYIFIHQIHIHHLVFGITLLLIAGFIRIPQFGSYLIRLSSIFYGIGAALTLDEFSIWLRLNPSAYFGQTGRQSIDVVVIFFLILLTSLWHGAFWRKIFNYTVKYIWRRKSLAD